jgi:hypothetical protein
MPAPEPLENDPANPCIGCGPSNPLGLRLAFARQGREVVADFLPGQHHQGWPMRLHSGVLYLAMLEAANWTFWGLTSKVGVPAHTSALEARRLVRIGEPVRLVGEQEGPEEVAVRALMADEVVARLTRRYRVLDREAFLRAMGYDAVPEAFAEAFP